MEKARIHSLESFGSVDGPGIRFVVFMQGCNMRCKYCHNPDSWNSSIGKLMSVNELYQEAIKYQSYWGEDGGITCSGGESLLQLPFLKAFFKKCHDNGINTVLDTSGNVFNDQTKADISELMENTDLVLLDLKMLDDKKHQALTGISNKNILAFAKYLSEIHKPVWIRYVLVPGITDQEEDLLKFKEFVSKLENVEKIEILPYHTMGKVKYDNLNIEYPLDGIRAANEDDVKRAKAILGI